MQSNFRMIKQVFSKYAGWSIEGCLFDLREAMQARHAPKLALNTPQGAPARRLRWAVLRPHSSDGLVSPRPSFLSICRLLTPAIVCYCTPPPTHMQALHFVFLLVSVAGRSNRIFPTSQYAHFTSIIKPSSRILSSYGGLFATRLPYTHVWEMLMLHG